MTENTTCTAKRVPTSRAGSVSVIAPTRGMVLCHICSRIVTANRKPGQSTWAYDKHFGRPR